MPLTSPLSKRATYIICASVTLVFGAGLSVGLGFYVANKDDARASAAFTQIIAQDLRQINATFAAMGEGATAGVVGPFGVRFPATGLTWTPDASPALFARVLLTGTNGQTLLREPTAGDGKFYIQVTSALPRGLAAVEYTSSRDFDTLFNTFQGGLSEPAVIVLVFGLASVCLLAVAVLVVGKMEQDYEFRAVQYQRRDRQMQLHTYRHAVEYVSHEIRGALNGIYNLVTYVKRERVQQQDAESQRLLGTVLQACTHVGRVLADITNNQEAFDQVLSTTPERIQVREFVRDLVHQYVWVAQRTVALQFAVTPAADTIFMFDRVRLRQIIGNAIDNAGRHTLTGLIRIYVTLDFARTRLLVVVDSTSLLRISSEQAAFACVVPVDESTEALLQTLPSNITLPYPDVTTWSTMSRSRETAPESGLGVLSATFNVTGLGIGLPLVAKLCAQLRCFVGLRSVHPGMTRFFVSLPFVEIPRDATVSMRSLGDIVVNRQLSDANLLVASRRVAVVEDDVLQHDTLTALCANLPVELTFFSGVHAFEQSQLSVASMYAILIDIVLGDGDGQDLCRNLRVRFTQCPRLVALTGKQSEDSDLITSGFDAVLRKPFTQAQLLAALEL